MCVHMGEGRKREDTKIFSPESYGSCDTRNSRHGPFFDPVAPSRTGREIEIVLKNVYYRYYKS